MNFPSVKTILPLCDKTNDQNLSAKVVRGLIDGTLDPDDTSTAVREWTRQCYNQPSKHERVMCAINDVLKGYGVEAIHTNRGVAEYVNFGDTYALTVLYFQGRYMVTSWGDFVERQERRGNISN